MKTSALKMLVATVAVAVVAGLAAVASATVIAQMVAGTTSDEAPSLPATR